MNSLAEVFPGAFLAHSDDSHAEAVDSHVAVIGSLTTLCAAEAVFFNGDLIENIITRGCRLRLLDAYDLASLSAVNTTVARVPWPAAALLNEWWFDLKPRFAYDEDEPPPPQAESEFACTYASNAVKLTLQGATQLTEVLRSQRIASSIEGIYRTCLAVAHCACSPLGTAALIESGVVPELAAIIRGAPADHQSTCKVAALWSFEMLVSVVGSTDDRHVELHAAAEAIDAFHSSMNDWKHGGGNPLVEIIMRVPAASPLLRSRALSAMCNGVFESYGSIGDFDCDLINSMTCKELVNPFTLQPLANALLVAQAKRDGADEVSQLLQFVAQIHAYSFESHQEDFDEELEMCTHLIPALAKILERGSAENKAAVLSVLGNILGNTEQEVFLNAIVFNTDVTTHLFAFFEEIIATRPFTEEYQSHVSSVWWCGCHLPFDRDENAQLFSLAAAFFRVALGATESQSYVCVNILDDLERLSQRPHWQELLREVGIISAMQNMNMCEGLREQIRTTIDKIVTALG